MFFAVRALNHLCAVAPVPYVSIRPYTASPVENAHRVFFFESIKRFVTEFYGSVCRHTVLFHRHKETSRQKLSAFFERRYNRNAFVVFKQVHIDIANKFFAFYRTFEINLSACSFRIENTLEFSVVIFKIIRFVSVFRKNVFVFSAKEKRHARDNFAFAVVRLVKFEQYSRSISAD